MVHLLPHWNHAGEEGEKIRVVAYTNASEVELFLNGKSLGKNAVEKYGHGEWLVPYERGELTAVAYESGAEVARDTVKTSGKAARLKLRLENDDIAANGRDMAVFTCYVEDENGVVVPDASPLVTFHAEGAGVVYSTGSDVSDHVSLFSPIRKMRAGTITVAVKLKKTAGELVLTAESDGLDTARLSVRVEA